MNSKGSSAISGLVGRFFSTLQSDVRCRVLIPLTHILLFPERRRGADVLLYLPGLASFHMRQLPYLLDEAELRPIRRAYRSRDCCTSQVFSQFFYRPQASSGSVPYGLARMPNA